MAGAQAHFMQAGKIGGRFAHLELITLARIGEGRMLIYLGDLTEGMALLDEAMVSIEAGELTPMATGDAYCTVIDACSELFDLVRCRSWTDSFTRWCDSQQELVLYRGHCFLHRAEVLGLLGAWPEALDEARHACERLASPVNPMTLGAACAIEGDLLRLLGDLDDADASYQRATEFGHDSQPGLSLLRLAQGRLDAAEAMIRRALGEAADPMSRVRLLGAYVEIVLTAGDVAGARAAADELRGLAGEIGTPLLRARAAQLAGTVLLAEGETTAALVELRAAFTEFNVLGARHDAACTRLLIAEACGALGDHDAAAMELAAARAALASLSVDPRIPIEEATASLHRLSARELEVLRLVARGETNRVIARDLVISEKTVASHISHIFTKLTVTSRSAATAWAYDHRIV
jgi:DNA-binding NarL/FixJ family response regulator